MKRFILLAAAMMLGIMLSAQTQQGYVKTKGRMVNDQLVPGQGLKGATVSIKGRTAVLVQSDDGAFSFPIPEAQFRVDSVRKKGYQLVDMDALSKTYKHSANPIYLVMETPEQQLQDQLAAERKIRRTLTKQLHQREDEIEALKEQQKISEEEYRQALQKLYEETDQNEQLVKDMVERYSTIDYDQLNEFDQKISEFILNGELVKADSMLRTKGDINQRVEQYHKHEAINAKEKEELSKRGAQLEQSEALAIQERDDLANDCYRKFEIFKMQHLNDSAAYYIELRAGLDTTNAEWADEAGVFEYEYLANYNQALSLFKRALMIRQNIFGINHPDIATSYKNIANVYFELGQYDTVIKYNTDAIRLINNYHPDDDYSSIDFYINLGTVSIEQGLYDKAMNYLQKALNIHNSKTSKEDTDLARIYNNIGGAYIKQFKSVEAMEYYQMALKIYQGLYGNHHQEIAHLYNNIGSLYNHVENYGLAIEYFRKTFAIQKEIFGENHPLIAATYSNMGETYCQIKEFDTAFIYLQKSLLLRERIFGENHIEIAISKNNLGTLFYEMGDIPSALDYYHQSLSILKRVFGDYHPYVASSYMNIATIHKTMGDYNEALLYFKKGLDSRLHCYGDEHTLIASSYKEIASVYELQENYDKALEYYQKSLILCKKIHGDDHHNTKMVQKCFDELENKIKGRKKQ